MNTRSIALAGLSCAAALTATTSAAFILVEEFTAELIVQINLPLPDDGVNFMCGGPHNITSLDFTPGSVTFQGQPVDFDGTEADFLGSSYNYNYQVPIVVGPATVPAAGSFSATGPGFNGIVGGDANIRMINLGPGFSSNNLDVTTPQGIGHTTNIPNWSSPAVPELNGTAVIIESDVAITGIDPFQGQLQVTVNGSIFARSCPWDCDGTFDGVVGVLDLLQLLAEYDTTAPNNCTGGACDYNFDGCVDVQDLLKLLAHYDPLGLGCP